MHDLELLEILAVGFSAALVLGYLTHRLHLSPIVGYLLAGFLVGPHSPGFVADARIAGQLAEVGVILLMFGVGLHFDLKDLLAVKRIALPGAIGQSLVATLLAVLIGLAFGMTLGAGLVLGLGVAVASTVVLMRVLVDNDLLDTPHGHVAVGWLIVEDLFTVLVLVLLPAIAASGGGGAGSSAGSSGLGLLAAFGLAVAKLALLAVLVMLAGRRLVPWIMAHVARSRSRELFTLTVLVLAIAIATGSAVFFGASVALGAFLAGMVVGKSELSHQAAADVLPMRDAFAVLFFISVGMLFDPKFVLANPALVLAILAVILLAKPLIACLIVIALGYSVRTALVVAIGLAQIGEFSFILARQAQLFKVLPPDGYSVLVACALISITLNPLLFRGLNPLEHWLQRRPRLWRMLNYRAERKGRDVNRKTRELIERQVGTAQAIVIGYGPVGRKVAELLRDSNVAPVIVDMNVDTISGLAAEGQPAVYGDGSRPDILKASGIAKAKYLLITLPDLTSTIAVITSAKQLNPRIRILTRARYLGAQAMLEGLGVAAISYEEEEVAKAMSEALIHEVQNPPRNTSH